MELEAGSQSTVYQLEYSEESVGKTVKSSKVRITWSFVCNGGREHEITLRWSKATGKQEICMDGSQIWFGRNKGRSVFDHNWTTRDDSLKLHVLGTCAPKMNAGFRCYDLLINGQLFASLPHFDRNGLGASPVPQHTGQEHLNSIIKILYPQGYVPPFDKKMQQRKEGRTSTQEDSSVEASSSSSTVEQSDNDGLPHQKVVDLLC
mmetsp:Transcript_13404/g.31554  ORF Transcript_13404/g.31554 Transcript_13404/m.31554 type:complete len:205 (-) Transcript_13404:214-828(-)